MEIRRIGPERGFVDAIRRIQTSVTQSQTKTNGNTFVRESLYTVDPDTGVATILGRLPDGSVGLKQHVNDITPPNKPSVPIVDGIPEGVVVTWDGLDVSGAAQPSDYLYTMVEISTDGFPWESAGTITAHSSNITIAGLRVETEYFIRLQSFDTNMNPSEYSGVASAVVKGGVGSDVNVDELREEFQTVTSDLNVRLQNNVQAQADLSGVVTNIKDVTLPALATDLSSAQSSLDEATQLLESSFPVTNDSIVDLDVSKLIAGASTIGTDVAEKIAAGTANIQRANIANLFVTDEANLNTVTAQRIAANVGNFIRLNVDQLVAGDANLQTATAERIAANVGSFLKLYASQLYIGEPGNLHPDPDFSDPEGWQIGPGYSISLTGGRNSNPALVVSASANSVGRFYGETDRRRQFRVTGGSRYRATVWVKPDATLPPDSLAIFSKWSNPSTAVSGNYTSPTSTLHPVSIQANQWMQISHDFTVPSEATQALVGFYALADTNIRLTFSEPAVKEMITPSLIVEGLIDGQVIRGVDILGGVISQESNGFRTRLYTDQYRGGVIEFSSGSIVNPGYLSMGPEGMDVKLPMTDNNRGSIWFKAGSHEDDSIWNPMYLHAQRGVGQSSLTIDGGIFSKREIYVSAAENPTNQSISLTPRGDSTSVNPDSNDLSFSGRGRIIGTADLRITAPNGITISSNAGSIVVAGTTMEDTGWRTASYVNNWTDYGLGFGGLQYRRANGVLYVRGNIKGGAFYTNVTTLPPGFRPVVPAGTSAMEFPITVIAGGDFRSGSIFAYASGVLTYYGPNSTWTGQDRVIINAAFPL